MKINMTVRWAAAILILFVVTNVDAHSGPFDGHDFKGRIAYSCDGNCNDEDDWGSFPVAVAMFDAFGLTGKLVHVDYCNIMPQNDPRFYREMVDSVQGSAVRYNISRSIMFDCQKDIDGAVDSIKNAVNASSAENPLYYILAGPMEVPFLGIQRSDPNKRKYVYCISHSIWNDGFPQREKKYLHRYSKRDIIETGINWVQVKPGSGLTNSTRTRSAPTQWALYRWMRDAKDPRLGWIYSRLKVEGRCDVSDATMTYFLLTGDEEATPAKLKAALGDERLPAPTCQRREVRIEAENFQTLENYELESRNDRSASHRVSVRQSIAGTGQICTVFDQPYSADHGVCDIEVRYFDEKKGRSELALLVNGVQKGQRWKASADTAGWQSKTIANVTVNTGDKIAVEVRADGGETGKLDYVQFNYRTQTSDAANSPVAIGSEILISNEEELKAAVASAKPGDTLIIRDSTYKDWRIALQISGTASAATTVRAQTPGGVKLTGNVRVEITGRHLVVSGFLFEDALSSRHSSIVEFRNAQHCRLTDCAFVRCGDPESTFTRTINMAYASRDNRVDHCYMTGTLSMGMGVVVRDSESGRGNTGNRFDHNYFKDVERRRSNGQEPIQLGQDQTAFGDVSIRAVVEYNLFDNASGDSEIVSNKSADNIIRRNTMRNSKAGICLRGGRNVLVEGNYCCRTRGIRIFGHGHTVVNNYLEQTEEGICLDAGQYRDGGFIDRETSGSYQAASGILIAHNTIVDPTRSGISLGSNRGTNHSGVARNELPRDISLVNNLVTGKSGILIDDNGSRDVSWRTNIAWPQDSAKVGLLNRGIIVEDPRLDRDDSILFVLRPDSPARDAGTALQEVTADYAGRKRDSSPDIGCSEIAKGAIVNRPLRPEDVGPSWMK